MDETRLAILRKTGGADVQDVIAALYETRAQLAEEQTAHATLRALWDARCGTIASVQARLTVAEGLLGEARLVAEHFGYGPLAVRIDAFLSPRLEPACVCGHTKSQHSGHRAAWGEDMPTHCSQADGCRKYRSEPAKGGGA